MWGVGGCGGYSPQVVLKHNYSSKRVRAGRPIILRYISLIVSTLFITALNYVYSFTRDFEFSHFSQFPEIMNKKKQQNNVCLSAASSPDKFTGKDSSRSADS